MNLDILEIMKSYDGPHVKATRLLELGESFCRAQEKDSLIELQAFVFALIKDNHPISQTHISLLDMLEYLDILEERISLTAGNELAPSTASLLNKYRDGVLRG